ncbi:hypothetical protein Ddye_016440 [Dipteronia dyeriana]|uniref:Transposase (putative) gypsy type domain-containing protein n=1 Tax=Dipteronia dyeriana TaxID=168575 RepID=A0AAD9U7F3_9ROSI|nr:hypothetical protein Ddye_016440 [Dipteronia dyeriana]
MTPGELNMEPPSSSRSKAGRFLIENTVSRLLSQEVKNLQFQFGIPESVKLQAVATFKRADWLIPGWTCFYYLPFRIGLRLPIPPLARKLLNFFNFTPSQLMPNGWRILLGLEVLIEIMNLEFSFEKFLYTYQLKVHDTDSGYGSRLETKIFFGPRGLGRRKGVKSLFNKVSTLTSSNAKLKREAKKAKSYLERLAKESTEKLAKAKEANA